MIICRKTGNKGIKVNKTHLMHTHMHAAIVSSDWCMDGVTWSAEMNLTQATTEPIAAVCIAQFGQRLWNHYCPLTLCGCCTWTQNPSSWMERKCTLIHSTCSCSTKHQFTHLLTPTFSRKRSYLMMVFLMLKYVLPANSIGTTGLQWRRKDTYTHTYTHSSIVSL